MKNFFFYLRHTCVLGNRRRQLDYSKHENSYQEIMVILEHKFLLFFTVESNFFENDPWFVSFTKSCISHAKIILFSELESSLRSPDSKFQIPWTKMHYSN